MIRDEFKEQQNKNVTSSEMKKIRQMGERAFYSSRVSLYTSSIKMLDFSIIFMLIAAAVSVPLLIFNILFSQALSQTFKTVMWVFIIVFAILGILWFGVVRIILKKKIEKYKQAIKELNEKNSLKQTQIFKN